jgi:hypothetical protein
MKTIYDDPITSQITRLSFYSKQVRNEAKQLHKFCEDMEQVAKFKLAAKKKKVKLPKKEKAEWIELSNEQKIIV